MNNMDNNDEKSLLDEIWESAGLFTVKNAQDAEETPEAPEEAPAEPEQPEEEPEQPEEEPKEPEKKKDIKFLAIYTTVFVAVIGLLIAGSYMISYRIHRQMDANQSGNDNLSNLQNVQDQRDAYKEKTETLTAENQQLTETGENADLLIGSAGDAMEQENCLIAAQNAYINDDKELATSLMHAIDHTKLSEPNRAYYEALAKLLNFEIPVIEVPEPDDVDEQAIEAEQPSSEETPKEEPSEEETPEEETPEEEPSKEETPKEEPEGEKKPSGILLPNYGA